MVFKREEELVRDLHGSIAAVKAIKNLLIGDKVREKNLSNLFRASFCQARTRIQGSTIPDSVP